jgi:hypothetical protein
MTCAWTPIDVAMTIFFMGIVIVLIVVALTVAFKDLSDDL